MPTESISLAVQMFAAIMTAAMTCLTGAIWFKLGTLTEAVAELKQWKEKVDVPAGDTKHHTPKLAG
jgi:hypothetical protein